jgi:hypothetical protein
MKNKLVFTLAALAIVASSYSQSLYGIVAFHKVTPGHTIEEALTLEREWKAIHQARKDAGLISNWAVFVNYNGFKTKDVDFDYITVNYGTDVDKVGSYPEDLWQGFVKTHPSYNDLLDRTRKVTNIIRQNLSVSESSVGTFQPNQIFVFEFMKVSGANYYTYFDFEKKMSKVHEERLKSGAISRWAFWRQILPSSDNGNAYFTTVQAFPNLSSYDKGGYTDEIAKKHFGLPLNELFKKAVNLREVETTWVASAVERL